MTTDLDFEDIIDLLISADDAYFNASELMSDSEYDRLKKRAYSIDPSHDYFTRVGSDVRGGKIKLPYSMGSLDQVYTGEIGAWLTKYHLDKKALIITDKLDGISCMLVYRNGVLEMAYSRGNGTEGADITRHIRHITKVPKTLKEDCYMVIRGELIMPVANFNKNWSKQFKNPRGTVAGTMNRDESNLEIIKDIDFVAYEITATSDAPDQTKHDQITRLTNNGFAVVNSISKVAPLDDTFLESHLVKVRANSAYELDGIVITADAINQVPGKRTGVSLNPEHSCKYKVNDAGVSTMVVAVHWEVSKSGWLKPRVELMPVNLNGTTVTFATGLNGRYIRDESIGPGAMVEIIKAGTVIPQIVRVISKAPTPSLPDKSTYGDWVWNANDVEIEVPDVDNNPQVKFKQVLHFVEKLNVDLLKEASLLKLFDTYNFWDDEYSQIIYTILDLKQKEWEHAIGVNGIKSYLSLHRRLQNAELATLMGASKFMGVGFGVRKAKSLISGCGGRDIWSLTIDDISSMDGFDTKTATVVVDGLTEAKQFIEHLTNSGYVNLVTVVKTDELANFNVVMTGFRDQDLSDTIEKRGGKVGSGVSKKTTHLLTFDPASNSGKAKKAKELGVRIMTPDEFKDEYNV